MEKPSETELKKRRMQLELWLDRINLDLDEEHQLHTERGDDSEWHLCLSPGQWECKGHIIKETRPYVAVVRYDDTEDYLKTIILAVKQYKKTNDSK